MGGGDPYSIYRGSLFCGNSHCFGGSVCLSLPLSFLLSFLTFVLSLCRLSKPDRYSRCSRDGFCPHHPTPLPFIAKEAFPPPPPIRSSPYPAKESTVQSVWFSNRLAAASANPPISLHGSVPSAHRHQHPRTSLSRPSCRFRGSRLSFEREDLLFRLRKLRYSIFFFSPRLPFARFLFIMPTAKLRSPI